MADKIEYRIHGDDIQIVEIELDSSEGVRAESGAMLFMSDGIQMQTGTGGGILKGIQRMFTGERFFITSFTNQGLEKAYVGFSAPYPGRVIPVTLDDFGGKFLCQKSSFLCAANGIEVGIEFTKKIGAGFFGGEGFVLQRLQGSGLAFVHAGGTIIQRDLGENETLRADTGCLVGFAPSVSYDIHFVGGVANTLFGGEGLFVTKLTGPGRVYLQSLPFSKLASRIHAAGMGIRKSGR